MGGPAVPVVLLAVLVAFAAFGVLTLIVGIRGRRIDDHPVCRRCRFDLAGVMPGAAVCPECGVDLARPRAIRIGQRRRRRLVIVLGAGIAIVSVVMLVGVGWGTVTRFNWNTIKPAWVLRAEAEGADPATTDSALTEFASRITNQRLSGEQVDALVKRAMEVQADTATPWVSGWGTLVEAARGAGLVDDALWAMYLRRSIDGAMLQLIPDRERRMIVVGMQLGPHRCGERAVLSWSLTLERLVVNGSEEYDDATQSPVTATIQASPAARARLVLTEIHSEVPIERVRATSTWTIQIRDGDGFVTPSWSIDLEWSEYDVDPAP